MVPMLVQSGYSAIAVSFDYWGLSITMKDALDKGKEFVKQVTGTETP